MSKVISFERLLSFLYSNPEKYKYHQDAPRFNHEEKKLLKAFAAYRSGNKNQVFELLRGKRFQGEFTEGVRCYLMALTYNHFGYLKFAKEFFNQAEGKFKESNQQQFLFYCLCEKFLLHSNLKSFNEMNNDVPFLEKYQTTNNYDQLLKNYALALHFFNTREEKKALKLIDTSLNLCEKAGNHFKNSFLMTLFRIQLRNGQYEECYKTLEKYKNTNGFTVDVNYKYIKFLLNFIVKDSPLYVYAKDFKHNPEIFEQLQCIDYLVRKQHKKAQQIWIELQKHNPQLYGDHFSFPDDQSLFSLALKKVLINSKSSDVFDKKQLKLINNTMDKLEYILNFFPRSITKSELIDYLWQEEVSEKSLKKLSRLMMKYKKIKGINIKSYQETYQISA